MKHCLVLCGLFLTLMTAGCAVALVGAGAAGGYKVATDERNADGMWDDLAITTKVKNELLKDPVTKAFQIDVDTLEGKVLLAGVVETKVESRRAVEIARSVPGVRKVTSNLQIGERTLGQSVDDTVTGSRIKAKLIAEPGIRALNIDVDVYNGVVILTGIVDSTKQRKRAIEIARSTSGVVRIVDNIKVKNH
ncbi:MAG: BON domain-containing protein [Deltaproteobacteria bacterium]|nr:BON domain-containing protein [Deltaproteobacteria bacterium]MBW2072402.1 BON domain-containing protein [Deltaproteobacteria bacterium]